MPRVRAPENPCFAPLALGNPEREIVQRGHRFHKDPRRGVASGRAAIVAVRSPFLVHRGGTASGVTGPVRKQHTPVCTDRGQGCLHRNDRQGCLRSPAGAAGHSPGPATRHAWRSPGNGNPIIQPRRGGRDYASAPQCDACGLQSWAFRTVHGGRYSPLPKALGTL